MHATQVGTNLTDSWKQFKRHRKDGGQVRSATEFADITAHDIVQEAEECNAIEGRLPRASVVSNEESTMSSVSCTPCREVTMLTLDKKKQVRYVWCSRVNVIERKVTMSCKNVTKDFVGLQVG